MLITILLVIALILAIIGAVIVTARPRAGFYFLTASVATIAVVLLLPVVVR